MATATSDIAVNGKKVTVTTDLNDGSYTVKYNDQTIGTGSASTGGDINFKTGSSSAQKQLLGLSGSRSRFLYRDLKGKIQNQVQTANINLLNKNASTTQKLNLRDMGYGEKLTTPLSGTLNGSNVGGNSGSDEGETTVNQENKETTSPIATAIPKAKSKWSEAKSARYPSKHLDSSADFIRFDIIEYKPTKNLADVFSPQGAGRPSERMKREVPKGNFILPIPLNVNVGNGVQWGPDNLNALQAGAGALVTDLLGGESAVDQIIAAVGNQNEELKKLVRQQAASTIAGGGNFLTRATGAVLNSNLELFFTGPGLRQFNFDYRLTPRDDNEAKEIKKIVRMCKRGMAPRLTDKTLFLYTPHIFKLAFKFKGNQDHPYMNKFKPCALTSFNVNFTPDNAYMTYSDGSPIAYSLQFAFQEIEPIYDADYSDGDGAKGMGF